ncbi:hypothetical protein BDB01DRAFT_897815, partial [Pilobolus umbonatus]
MNDSEASHIQAVITLWSIKAEVCSRHMERGPDGISDGVLRVETFFNCSLLSSITAMRTLQVVDRHVSCYSSLGCLCALTILVQLGHIWIEVHLRIRQSNQAHIFQSMSSHLSQKKRNKRNRAMAVQYTCFNFVRSDTSPLQLYLYYGLYHKRDDVYNHWLEQMKLEKRVWFIISIEDY